MALYDLKKRPALTSKEDEGEVYYPKLVSSGKITTEQLLRELSEYSAFNTGEAEGILCDLLHLVSKHVSEGYRVELGDFGVFSAKLKSAPITDPNNPRKAHIHFNGVQFAASKKFKNETIGRLERHKDIRFRQSEDLGEEKRKQLLLDYLDKKGFINRVIYSKLTGRLKDVALKDLKEFVDQGIIRREGRGNQLYFIKAVD